ncbi:MAG: hypothetical protein HN501_03400 [Waddliaceae bacterium]|nr:hypothetical protein [Waddliaceae bacterium]MBT7461448.1 hypothetical protein [Waddliaceae bacterium]
MMTDKINEETSPVDLLKTLQSKGVEVAEDGDADFCIEDLALLVQAHRLKALEKTMKTKTDNIKEKQGNIKYLHSVLTKINNSLDKKDKLDISKNNDLKGMFGKAREMGVDIPKDKKVWTKDEKERLLDSIRTECEDLSSENQMSLQDTQALMNQRFETYELTKSILKPLHDDKINKARKMAGGQ